MQGFKIAALENRVSGCLKWLTAMNANLRAD